MTPTIKYNYRHNRIYNKILDRDCDRDWFFLIRNSNWTEWSTIQRVYRARNFKSASRFALVRFRNYSRDYFLNCTPLGPITITN